MLVRRLDDSWDMTFGHGLANYLRDNNDAIGQNIKSRLLLILGEWFLDTSDGTPWQAILGVKRVDNGFIEAALRARIQGTEGVVEITQFSLGVRSSTRAAMVVTTVRTIYSTMVTVEV